MKKRIKLFDPKVDFKEEKAILKILRSHYWASGTGIGNVAKFEEKFRNFVNSRECVALNSGTAALHLALSLVDIRNKEVILPSLSFVSTAHAVKYHGGKPIFVDVEPETLCIDPNSVKKAINKNTKVILPVHFGGMPCNLDEIISLCRKNNLFLIEDAAHAAGSRYKGKRIGKHGTAVCFSFHPVKNLAMPSGGAITLNGNKAIISKNHLKALRWCGISNRKGSTYDVNEIGWNYYMNEFSAAIGLEQLKKLEKMNEKRKKIAKIYQKEINLKRKMPFDKGCSYHLYWIQVNNRTRFMKKLLENNIETGIHYHPIHKMKLYRNNKKLKNTEEICKQIVSLPIHPNLTDSDVSKIIHAVNRFS